MRGTKAKMIRKSVAHFPKEELKVKIYKGRDAFELPMFFPKTFRYSANSFQRNYKDAKRAVA